MRALLFVAASILVACLSACATSSALDSAINNESDLPQPIVTRNGPVTESAGNDLLVQVTGADTERERAQLKHLTDSVRASLSSPLVAGNKVAVLVDGPATFAAIDKAVAQARHHIHVETYIFADDELGRKFATLLIEKKRQGVEVRVIYDAIGSIETTGSFFEDLRAGGVEVIQFQPLNPVRTWFWQFHNRDHRKIIVVDGRIAFTGGLNISEAYSAASSTKPGPEAGLKEGWRDTHVQIEGPVVEQFQRLFLETWAQLQGKLDAPRAHYYPELTPCGDHLVSAVASSGLKERDEAIFKTYLTAIENASKRVWITQAYLLPPKKLSDALISAARRGVDVRIVVPGFSDSKLVLHASHHEYEGLLKGGVRLFESNDALLHAKTALIDDSLAIIGSANLDYRSFLHNNEVTAVIIGHEAAQRMDAIFRRDLTQGTELTLEKWQQRSAWQRTQESLSSLLKFWL